jgi:hypothetical protein
VTPYLIALLLQAGAASAGGSALWASAALPSAIDRLVQPLVRHQPAAEAARYDISEKSVSTWESETRRALSPAPLAVAAVLLGAERPVVTRCVKLNNPWCIKRARWPGEIGADDEGHTAFASLDRGADAAARLLRSYYVAFDRRSALDIVRRWAPAECRVGGGALPSVLAVKGIAMTLRARFLARQGRGGRVAGRRVAGGPPAAAQAARPRASAVPVRAFPEYRVPDIAAGLGERAPARPIQPAPRPRIAWPAPAPVVAQVVRRPRAAVERIDVAAGAPACGGDETRIQNYASRIAGSVGLGPADDLKLFDVEGRPSPNLPAVMLAMSSVELGYLYAGVDLIEGAVGRLALLQAPADSVPPAPAGVGPPPASGQTPPSP